MPSSMNTLELIPLMMYITEIDGQAIPLGETVTFDMTGRDSWEFDTDYVRLDQAWLAVIEN